MKTIFSKKTKKARQLALVLVSILALVLPFAMPRATNAATMTVLRLYLNRQQADITTGVQFELFFTPATNVSGGSGVNKVIFYFPTAAEHNTKWCRTVGTGDLVITGITDPTGGSESATVLPGTTKTGACTQTPDTFTISGVDDLTAGTKYGVRVAMASSTVIGTTSSAANNIQVSVKTNNGTSDIDTGTLATSIIASDQVVVTAAVTPTLSVLLSGNTAALGILAAATVNQAGITSQIGTNASGGYISMVKYDDTLTSGTDTIADTAGGTIAAGTAEYGASSSQAGNTIAQWSPTACSNTATTSNATALTTVFQAFAASATPTASETTTLCFLASITAASAAGSYHSNATVVTTARF